MTPRLIACYSGGDHWQRMARVLAHTAALNCSAWDRRIERYVPPPLRSITGKQAHIDNAQKHAYWASAVDDAPDGTPMLLMDADTMIVRPLDDVWTFDFDLAYTVREFRPPFNAGVIFLRASNATRAFMRRWHADATDLLQVRDGDSQRRLRQCLGVAQAAFDRLLPDAQLLVRTLPCQEWNCETTTWSSFDPKRTRVVHVNGSRIRRALFPPYQRQPVPPTEPHLRALFQTWYRYEAAAHRGVAEQTA